jgi:aminoglycoside phosphotransferase (APT) family kinase protein
MAPLNERLGRRSPVPVPRVLRTASLDGRTYAVLDRLPGLALATFRGQPDALLEQLGRCLAALHGDRSGWWGSPAGAGHELSTFHPRAVETARRQVERFFRDDPTVAPGLEPASRAMLRLPEPRSASPVMPDIDPTQYLWDGRRLTGLVDTEAYVVAPPELELVAAEYLLDRPGAAAFERGYRSVAPLPDLRAVRAPYRYLLRVLDALSVEDLGAWADWPALLRGEARGARSDL